MNNTGKMVLGAFEILLSDTSVPLEETLEMLREIREEMDIYIEAIRGDLARMEHDGS